MPQRTTDTRTERHLERKCLVLKLLSKSREGRNCQEVREEQKPRCFFAVHDFIFLFGTVDDISAFYHGKDLYTSEIFWIIYCCWDDE